MCESDGGWICCIDLSLSPAVATQLKKRLNKTFILEKTLLSCRQLEENTLVFACM